MSKDLFMEQREREELGITAPAPPKSMFTIRQDHLTLLALIEEAEGELTPEMEQALSLTQEDFENKAVSYAYVVKGFENTQEVIDKEIKRLTELKKRAAAREELFKERLAEAMVQFGIEKIETPTIKLSFRKSSPVELADDFEDRILKYANVSIAIAEDKLKDAPEEDKDIIAGLEDLLQYFDLKPSASKKKIGEALKQGIKVLGAKSPEKKNLQIK